MEGVSLDLWRERREQFKILNDYFGYDQLNREKRPNATNDEYI